MNYCVANQRSVEFRRRIGGPYVFGWCQGGLALRIALLEDDAEQAVWIAQLLETSGHNVDKFHRGRTLLRRMSSESYDLLVLDWELPDLSGLEVLRAIRDRLDTVTPVLFVTHRESESDIVDALEAGADDYLVKPPR